MQVKGGDELLLVVKGTNHRSDAQIQELCPGPWRGRDGPISEKYLRMCAYRQRAAANLHDVSMQLVGTGTQWQIPAYEITSAN